MQNHLSPIPATRSFGRLTLSLFFVALQLFAWQDTEAQFRPITNDKFWDTADGKPIYSQGGGIFRFTDPASGQKKYFWYGVHYKQAETYRENPAVTQPSNTFESVTCYSSTDLVNWTFENDVMTKTSISPTGRTGWVGRLGVAYVPEAKKYALFVQHGGRVMVATGDTPAGAFTVHQEINMTAMIGTSNTGDQTVFTDEDSGKSYLVYSYGQGRNKGYVSEIGVKDGKIGLLDCTKVFEGAGREGNCMFKYKGKYYLCASDLYGWDSSHAYYLVADDIRGPYLPVNDMLVMDGCVDDYAHVTQTGFFYTVRGTKQETVIYCGDRWADFAGNGLGYNQWVPLSFSSSKPYFNSLSAWELDARTGEWRVARNNNYVRNGSFEADRKAIPSTVKPVQEQLSGWMSHVIEGTPVALRQGSPVLNHANTEIERKAVVGERSLNLSDNVPFKRKVNQVISSSPYVKLADGMYLLTAKVKNSAGFVKLNMYASSGGVTHTRDILGENTSWVTFEQNVRVKGGKVEVGFYAEGAGGSFCYVDDILLTPLAK